MSILISNQKIESNKKVSSIKEFLVFLHDEIVLTHMVSVMAYGQYKKQHLQNRQQMAIRSKISESELDKKTFFFSDGNPDNPLSTIIAVMPQGELVRICEKNGYLCSELGKMLVVFLYQSWDEKYRAMIGAELGFSKKDKLNSDIFGDLRNIRRDIIHKNSVANYSLENKVFTWFKEGDEIIFDEKKFRIIIENIVREMYKLADQAGITEKISPIPTFWLKTIFDRKHYE